MSTDGYLSRNWQHWEHESCLGFVDKCVCTHSVLWMCCPHEATLHLWCWDLTTSSSPVPELQNIVKFLKNKQVSAAMFQCYPVAPALSKSCCTWSASFIKFLKHLQTCKKALESAAVKEGMASCCSHIICPDILDDSLFWLRNSKWQFHIFLCQKRVPDH